MPVAKPRKDSRFGVDADLHRGEARRHEAMPLFEKGLQCTTGPEYDSLLLNAAQCPTAGFRTASATLSVGVCSMAGRPQG